MAPQKQRMRGLRIAVASGKGGTGKTMVALNLAAMFGQPVQLADCDVEEPNDALFLPCERHIAADVTMLVPQVDPACCTGCGACSELCQFHGIVSLGTKALVFPELCHGCGGCVKICPTGALSEHPRRLGTVTVGQSHHIRFIEGRLEVGAALVPPVIRAVRDQLHDDVPAILDAPPGTSCPVVATIRECDYLLLVTDPTPFGFHDLRLTVALARELGLPCGVVINRYAEDRVGLLRYCQLEGLPVLLTIPDDRLIAEVVSKGELIATTMPEYGHMFADLAIKLQQHLLAGGER